VSRLEGMFGWAEQVDPAGHPNAVNMVCQWLMCLPGQGLGYDRFMLAIVDLQHRPGQPEPVLRYPAAQYELLVCGLDPDHGPDPADPTTFVPLEPVNFCDQFHGVSRVQASALGEILVRACLAGRLIAETQVYVEFTDGRPPKMMAVQQVIDIWKNTVRRCVDHIVTGGLHERVN
jgi:hypothetical protein